MIVNGRKLLAAAPIKNMLPAKCKAHGVSHGLSEAGYDIRIAQSIEFLPYAAKGREYAIFDPQRDGEMVEAGVGTFALASTVDEFQVPNNLVGIVHDKSTWARYGLSVLNTVIEPGWKGFLTLELVYHGANRLFIPAGAGIAQVLFHQIAEPAAYDGKYQHQEDGPVEARHD